MKWLFVLLFIWVGVQAMCQNPEIKLNQKPEVTPIGSRSSRIYCSGQNISVAIDVPNNTVNRWMWDVCLLTPVDPDAVVSAEYGHFDGTDFSSAITNHGDAPIQVRFQIFVSKDGGTHYAAPEIFIVTIQPEITQLTVVGNCGGNQNLVGQLHAQTNLTINGNVTYRWFQTSPTAPNGITLLEGQGENIFQISPLDEGRYGVEVKNEGCQPAPYYFYHRPGDLAWSTTPAMSNENIYFTGSNPRIEEAEFDHCNLYFFGFTNTATNVPGGEVLGQFLRVSENGSLNMSYSTASSACENMWGGILMEEGAQIEATNSTIMDARWAVDADGVTAGCVMTACTLANNLNGVRFNHWISEGFTFTENIITSNYLHMKRPYDYHANSLVNPGGGNLGTKARFMTQKGLQLGYLTNFIAGSLNGNVFENCLIGLETGIRTSGVGPVATVTYNQFINCTWKGANTAGYGIIFSHCWFGFPTDLSWVNTWQSQTFRGLTFGPNQEHQSVYGIFNKNGGVASGLGTVSNCNFYSAQLPGSSDPLFIGINTESAVAITSNTFEKLNTGIDLEAIENNSISIQGNTFRDNVVGVELKANENNTTVPVLGFSLRCNNFEQTTSVPTGQQRIGLLIGEGVSFFDDRIGGNNQNQTGPPNSNYFPRTINSTTQAIEPFPGYYSVWNESANQNSYYNYANEDLGNVYPQQTSGLPNYVDDEPVSDISITRQNLENWCLEVPSTATQPNWQGNGVVLFPLLVDCREMEESELGALKTAQLIPNNWVLACEGGPLDHIAFPIPKPLASSIVSEMVESLTKDKVYLGQSIPNPANHRVTIPVLLAEFKGNMVLEIFDLASGKTMSQKVISSLGQHMVDFDVQTWAAGIYGYRILLPEGKSPAPKKMVLVK